MRTANPAPVNAVVRVPGSKSLTNRALVCASLAGGDSVIINGSDSEDTALMVNGLNQLGILVRRSGEELIVEGKGGRLFAPKFPVPVGNAGTTLRFLIGLASLADGTVVFEGSGRMSERPVAPLTDALRSLGVESEVLEFAARYAVRGGTLDGGEAVVKSDVSSQFVSSLLMVAPYATGDVRIRPEGEPVSAPYVTMTRHVMRAFGIETVSGEQGFLVKSGGCYRPGSFTVEPDVSSAAFLFGVAAVTGGSVEVEGIREDLVQGDIRILDYLKRMGCVAEQADTGTRVTGSGELKGIDVDLRDNPDLFPVLAGVALFAGTPSRFTGIQHLRYKESDRLETVFVELNKLGAETRPLADGVEVMPAPLTGCELDPHDDHRLAMCFGLIGLRVNGVTVRNPSCVKKSFPGFWQVLATMKR